MVTASRLIGVAAVVGVVLLLATFHVLSDRFEANLASFLRAGVVVFLLVAASCAAGVLLLLFFASLLERREDAGHFARERRRVLSRKIALFRRVVSVGRVQLEVFEYVFSYLSAPPTEPSGGFRERRLHRRYASLHAEVARVMARSRNDSLDEALARLGAAKTGRGSERDWTPSVWYMNREPENYAVRRLLYEHLHAHASELPRVTFRFVCGVVVTPRWVWELAVRGERAWATGRNLTPTIHEECVPLDGADVETLRALYEPGTTSPMGSLAEAAAAARVL